MFVRNLQTFQDFRGLNIYGFTVNTIYCQYNLLPIQFTANTIYCLYNLLSIQFTANTI